MGKWNSNREEIKRAKFKIIVKFFATIRLVTGVSEMEVEVTSPVTILKLIEICSEKLGKKLESELVETSSRDIKQGAIILVNGKNILHLNRLDTTISEDSVVSIFPPAGGG